EFKEGGTNGTLHPEDLAYVAEAFTKSLASGSPYQIVHRVRRSDGVYRWFQSSGVQCRDASGQTVQWCSVLTDVDERKRAEEELRRASDSCADAQRLSKTGSFITDLVGDDHNWSAEAYRIFEFQPGTKVTLQRIQAIIHPDDERSFEAMIARAMCG